MIFQENHILPHAIIKLKEHVDQSISTTDQAAQILALQALLQQSQSKCMDLEKTNVQLQQQISQLTQKNTQLTQQNTQLQQQIAQSKQPAPPKHGSEKSKHTEKSNKHATKELMARGLYDYSSTADTEISFKAGGISDYRIFI